MALVGYGNSDSSEFEDDDNEAVPCVTLNKKVEVTEPSVSKPASNSEQNEVDQPDNSQSLFNLLPRPVTKKPAVVEEDDEFLHKKENVTNAKPKAKISVPSLSDFKDVEVRPAFKPKTHDKKSGLLSMLPQPRNTVTTTTRSFVPHVLTKKPNTVKKKEPLPVPLKKAATTLVTNYSDDSDNDDEVQNDFFSINKPVDVPIVDIPLDIDDSKETDICKPSQKPYNIESYFKQDMAESQMEIQPDYAQSSSHSAAEHYGNAAENSNYSSGNNIPESSRDVLDEEAILKLCGSRAKRRREDIQIVDVNQKEVLADAKEWLLKGLMDDTSKRISSSKKKGNEPTNQQKRKHQITYLAHQAKANEVELQNQWANNRMSKRQTQSKYGF